MYKFGVDVGGTTIKIGLFTAEGELLEKFEIPTDKSENGSHIIGHIAVKLNEIITGKGFLTEDCFGIGIGLPGPVDDTGRVLGCVNLGWGIVEIEREMSQQFHGRLVKAGNDANVAALGEAVAGAGYQRKNLVMVTLGTGVGGGIIVNGDILTGANGAAGEIGHITVNPEETQRCNCGKCGCLEQYASATGVVRIAKQLTEKYKQSELIEHIDELTAKDVFDAAKRQDALAREAVAVLGKYLGMALSSVVCVTNPEAIVFGGGVSRAGQILFDEVEKNFVKYVFSPSRHVEFLPAKLGNDAGIYGAAALIDRG